MATEILPTLFRKFSTIHLERIWTLGDGGVWGKLEIDHSWKLKAYENLRIKDCVGYKEDFCYHWRRDTNKKNSPRKSQQVELFAWLCNYRAPRRLWMWHVTDFYQCFYVWLAETVTASLWLATSRKGAMLCEGFINRSESKANPVDYEIWRRFRLKAVVSFLRKRRVKLPFYQPYKIYL